MDAPSDRPQWLPPEAPGARPNLTEAAPAAAPTAALPATPVSAQPLPTQQPPVQGWYPQPPPGQPHAYGVGYYQPQDTGPGNESAVAAFVLALSGIGLLMFFAGFSAPITLVLGILAIVYGRKGKRKVDGGETAKHRGLAQAGLIIGVVTVVLSLLAAAGWTLFFIYADDLSFENLEPDDPGGPDGFQAVVGAALEVAQTLTRGLA